MKHVLFLILLASRNGTTGNVKELAPIGNHYEIFRLEKSENPQNILVVFTRLNERCQFVLDSESPTMPTIGFYWLMDHEKYKRVHPLIRGGIRDRLKVLISADFPKSRKYFAVQVKDLKQVDPDLHDAYVQVSAQQNGKVCSVKSTFDADPGQKGSSLFRLDTIYAESKKTLLPPFRKVTSLRFEGQNEKTGKPEQKIFKRKQ